MKKAGKKILVAPLDWGLGHAARCVPVINELLNNNTEVIIAADRQPLAFLKKEFPGIETLVLPGYEISYPAAGGNMASKMAIQLPKILSKIRKENELLQNIIKKKNINGIISDQRFGLHTDLVPCAFITHQIMIKAPLFENILYKISKNIIKKYSECWIPDFDENENLSGDLSHKFPLPVNARFIGPLSRFSGISHKPSDIRYQLMAIISGPEPQRTIFEKIILYQLENSGKKAVVARGLTGIDEHYENGNVEIHSHLGSGIMAEKIMASEIIISRAGYSSIMDLAALQKKAILVPTPGQTEQEYLAGYHYQKKHFFFAKQDEFELQSAFKHCANFTGINKTPQAYTLKRVIREFTEKC